MIRRFWIVWVLLFTVVGMQSLGAPRGAGPDEPAHLIRAAALVRGDVFGTAQGDDLATRLFDAPEWAGQPEPGCFAFQPDQPASCATFDTAPTTSSAGSYPVFGHVLPGVGTLLPGDAVTAWGSRLLGALLPTLLVAWTIARLAAADAWVVVAAVLLALTPMALFSMAIVNPSGLMIGGAIALWISGDELARGDQSASSLFAASWAAVVLSRPDGLMWVAAITVFVLIGAAASPSVLWATMGARSRIAVSASTVAALAWSVLVRPALIDAPAPYTGWGLIREIIGRTGSHLREAIGVLGWLDTPIPTSMFLLWTGLLGMLTGVALVSGSRRRIGTALLILLTAVAVSWTLDFLQAPAAGLFWQGRYGLPLLVGVVLQLGLAQGTSKLGQTQVMSVLLGGVWVVWNFGFLQALRRWGVGESGSMLPWEWSTWSMPVPLELIIAVHALASALLMVKVWQDSKFTSRPPRSSIDPPITP